ncbi:MFS transporter [Roseinatronobacter alkalisoli]|uniref:MFS transporter n=1 Tax=Roseinatronobacter alkalisoli TaxID=3028235 RepID=A0ABT5TEA6_9RHOB|nr:MFS transporter [Roseinatronobacter sp. HJB301]MDD7973356.1 MFS transporter [Roseinatronobacter sp. HJB301]
MSYYRIRIQPNLVQHAEIAALLAAVLLVGSNAFVLSPILTDVAEGLETAPFRIAWAISSFGAATAVSALTLAGLVDRMPAGRVLGGAALVLAFAQVASGISPNWVWLCLSQAVAGGAVGVLLPGTYATAVTTAPPGRAAARLGLVLTGWALSLVLAVPLAAVVAEQFGWRMVYALLAGLSGLVGLGLMACLRNVRSAPVAPIPLWRALRLPGVVPLLLVMFTYMTAFYGSFAFFGEGLRTAFELSVQGIGLFVLAYGLGFGLAGLGLGILSPAITRGYVLLVLLGIAASYAGWAVALAAPQAALLAAMIWGVLNQLGLNALVVSLNQRAAAARGAVMGLNSAVSYSAVFAGPMIMGPVFAGAGFAAVSGLAAALVVIGAVISRNVIRRTP